MNTVTLWQLVLHFDQHLGSFVAQHGIAVYAVLFAIIFCEIGLLPLFFLPGDPLVFFCGALAAIGALDVWVLTPLLFIATVGGSALSYAIGHRIGHELFRRDYRLLDRHAMARGQAFYARYGRLTFLLSPYIAVVRTFAPFAAGVSLMPGPRFLVSVCAGALLWIGGLVAAGFFFGNVPLIRDHMNTIVLAGIGLGVGSLLVGGLLRRLRND